MSTIETVVIHQSVAELIAVFGGWDVQVALDDSGPYISLTNVEDASDYRCLALSDEGDEEVKWQFWNEANNVWFDSTLGADAGAEEILGFLKDALAEEQSLKSVAE